MSEIENIKKMVSRVIIRDLELNIAEDDLRNAGSLDQLFGMDSIAMVELIIGIEKEFGIRIPPEQLNASVFTNLNTIAEYVQKLIHDG